MFGQVRNLPQDRGEQKTNLKPPSNFPVRPFPTFPETCVQKKVGWNPKQNKYIQSVASTHLKKYRVKSNYFPWEKLTNLWNHHIHTFKTALKKTHATWITQKNKKPSCLADVNQLSSVSYSSALVNLPPVCPCWCWAPGSKPICWGGPKGIWMAIHSQNQNLRSAIRCSKTNPLRTPPPIGTFERYRIRLFNHQKPIIPSDGLTDLAKKLQTLTWR